MGCKKAQKGLQTRFMTVKKSRKFYVPVIYSYLKHGAFTAVKRDAKS